MDEHEKLLKHLESVNSVAVEYLKGSDIRTISKTLDLPKARVSELLTEWRSMASSNEAINSRAREALMGMDQHYGQLISKAYEVIDSADQGNNLSAKTNALKLIVDIEAKRLDALHRAGLLDNKQLADEMVEMERKQEILTGILRDITAKCDHCRPRVMERMSQYANGKAVPFDY